MENIIVTVTDEAGHFSYDLEVSTKLEINKLLNDIVEALNGYNPELFLNALRYEVVCIRTNHIIGSGETLEDAGIWNGDILVLKRKESTYE